MKNAWKSELNFGQHLAKATLVVLISMSNDTFSHFGNFLYHIGDIIACVAQIFCVIIFKFVEWTKVISYLWHHIDDL